MKLPEQIARRFRVPQLTRKRIILALAVAVVADALQFLLLPLEWMLIDQIIDVVAMVLTCAILGFHWLLLPTFAVEFIPVMDLPPFWTACVLGVIALRKRSQSGDH